MDRKMRAAELRAEQAKKLAQTFRAHTITLHNILAVQITPRKFLLNYLRISILKTTHKVGILLSQLLNACTGGDPDESFSARVYRTNDENGLADRPPFAPATVNQRTSTHVFVNLLDTTRGNKCSIS